MELSGNLKRFPVSNVLQFLGMESATGILTLKRGRTRVTITLDEGNALDVEHSDKPKEQRLGALLVESGRITVDELESVMEERRRGLAPLGTILHSRGLINDSERQRTAALVCTEILFEVLAWKEGTYEFKRLDLVEPIELYDAISTQSVMLNAAQQEDEWPQIRRYVRSAEAIFAPSPSNTLGLETVKSSLGLEDREIAERIDGLNSVRKIAAVTLRSEFEVSRLIAELSRRGLVVPIQRAKDFAEEAKPSGFFSLGVGTPAIAALSAAFILVLVISAWQNYISPIISNTQRTLAPIINAGRDPSTVDRLHLQRLLQAFQLYRDDHGSPPGALITLARMGYCSASDLETFHGGHFILKVIGDKEQKVLIAAVDEKGRPLPELAVEINLQQQTTLPEQVDSTTVGNASEGSTH
jgi:hypothetical protein